MPSQQAVTAAAKINSGTPKKGQAVERAPVKRLAQKSAPRKSVIAKPAISKPIAPKTPATSEQKEAQKLAAVTPQTSRQAQKLGKPLAGVRDWRIVFAANSTDLTDEGRRTIGKVAALLAGDTGKKVSIRAHADSSKGGAGAARRLSFSRAITIRAALINKGVLSTRMHLWARGDRDKVTPRDLVEIRLIDQ